MKGKVKIMNLTKSNEYDSAEEDFQYNLFAFRLF